MKDSEPLPGKVYLVVKMGAVRPVAFASWSKAACYAYTKSTYAGDYKVVGPYSTLTKGSAK